MSTNRLQFAAAAAFAVFALAAVPARADLVSVGDQLKLSTGLPSPGFDVSRSTDAGYGGGPFQLTNQTTPDSWVSFCIERGEGVSSGTVYTVTGVGFTTSSGVDLSDAASWLYERFRLGGLTHASFGGAFDAMNKQHTKILQYALWLAQGYGLTSAGVVGTEATLAANLRDFAALQTHSGIVRIVQLGSAQDQLALRFAPPPPPVPEPGALVLLGVGLIGLAGAMRRRRLAR